jgi:hypothetical protein
MTALFEQQHQQEDCEMHLLQIIKAEIQKLWDRTVIYFNEVRKLEIRRHPDTHEEIDYEYKLRELEGQIEQIDREQRGFRFTGHYHEGGGGKWDKYAIPGLVTLAVSGIIGNVVQAMQVSALRQEVTDLKAQVDKIEKLVEPRYRGIP